MFERMRVLVVDDDYAVRATFVGVLSRDHQMSEASSAEEALELLMTERRMGKKFDVIMSDVDMPLPGINGIEFLRLVKANNLDAGALLIVMSGGDRTAADLATIKGELGAEFLLKPVSPIRETVAGLIARNLAKK